MVRGHTCESPSPVSLVELMSEVNTIDCCSGEAASSINLGRGAISREETASI